MTEPSAAQLAAGKVKALRWPKPASPGSQWTSHGAGLGALGPRARPRLGQALDGRKRAGLPSGPFAKAGAVHRTIWTPASAPASLLDKLFRGFDAVVAPLAPGEVPVGLGSTGSPAFCMLWPLTGSPAVSLPLGCQLVGTLGDDPRLLRTAN
jgi:hypothetical protein